MVTVGRYRMNLRDRLGRGAFGVVYKALDMTTGRFVAVKQVNVKSIPKEKIGPMLSEIDLLRTLTHPNIVGYYEFIRSKDFLNIVLELVENGSLEKVVKEYGMISEELTAFYMAQVLDGLIYLHEQGVVHRDIKCANLLITRDSVVKLADFGVATKLKDTDVSSSSENVVGTPYWMAPEVISFSGSSTASDIWSVGCTVIELLTGKPPYFDEPPHRAIYRIVDDLHPALPEGISDTMRQFLMACFEKDPRKRATAEELRRHPLFNKVKLPSLGGAGPGAGGQQKQQRRRELDGFSDEEDEDEHKKSSDNLLGGGPRPAGGGDNANADSRRAPKEKGKGLDGGGGGGGGGDAAAAPPPAAVSHPHPPPPPGITPKGQPMDLSKFVDNPDDDLGDAFPMVNVQGLTVAKSLSARADASGGAPEDDEGDIFSSIPDLPAKPLGSGRAPAKSGTAPASAVIGRRSTVSGRPGQGDTSRLVTALADKSLQEGALLQVFGDLQTSFSQPASLRDFLSLHGTLPLLGHLAHPSQPVKLAALSALATFAIALPSALEHLCLVGAVPLLTSLASAASPLPIRLPAARLLYLLCHTSSVCLQMFIACRGWVTLIELISSGNEALALTGIDCVGRVFDLHSVTPKGDFAKLMTDAGLVAALIPVLQSVVRGGWGTPPPQQQQQSQAQTPPAPSQMTPSSSLPVPGTSSATNMINVYPKKCLRILLLCASSEATVRVAMCGPVVLSGLLGVIDNVPDDVVLVIMRIFKRLSTHSEFAESIQDARAVSQLCSFLDPVRAEGEGRSLMPEIRNQAMATVFNLVSIDRRLQDLAASSGAVPFFLGYAREEGSSLREFSLRILFAMVRSSRNTRNTLWNHGAVGLLLELLPDEVWRVGALDALSFWINDESAKLSTPLEQPGAVNAMINAVASTDNDRLVGVLEHLLSIVTASERVNRALGRQARFMELLKERMRHPEALVRVHLLKIIRAVYELHHNPKELIARHELIVFIQRLTETDKAVLVKSMCEQLSKAFYANAVV
jgi:serine/threonine protein kinase